MGQELSIIINGQQVKELRCKNDDCMALFGYAGGVKLGVFFFNCPKCGYLSCFRMGYNEAAKDFMDKLHKKFEKGTNE